MEFFSALPELCLSEILTRMSPRDVCRSSAISKGFKSVADSDYVWDQLLPSDYREIVSRSVSPVRFSTKKKLYIRLAGYFILLDDNELSFALDKATGKKCFLLGPPVLTIECRSPRPEYGEWMMSLPESRFWIVPIIRAVFWFDIKSKIEARLLSPRTTYVAYLVFRFIGRNYGFGSLPANASVRFIGRKIDGDGDEDEITNLVYLKPQQCGPEPTLPNCRFPQKRKDEWMEIELGEFYNGQADSGEVEMRLRDNEGRNCESCDCESGIIVEGIEIRPKVEIK